MFSPETRSTLTFGSGLKAALQLTTIKLRHLFGQLVVVVVVVVLAEQRFWVKLHLFHH